jgi:putative transposase
MMGHCQVASCADGMLDECMTAYRGHRFPKEIISHCIWLYFWFGVSLRDVEELMAARGVLLSYETVRRWCDKFW